MKYPQCQHDNRKGTVLRRVRDAAGSEPPASLFASSSTPRLDGHDRARLAQATLLSNGASSAKALALLAHKSVSFQP